MPTSTRPMSVAEVLEIEPTENSWVNDGFTAIVRSIKQPSPNAQKKFWKCVLGDTTGSATINMTVFFAPKFGEGQQIDVLGQGIKRKEYNGQAEVSVGQKTEIHVVGTPVPSTASRQPQPEAHAPSAGAGQPADDAGSADPFHRRMRGTALLYLQCLSYACKINTTLKTDGYPEMPPDHFQACVSTLFITADKNGLSLSAPALSSAAPAEPAQPAARPAAPAGGRADNVRGPRPQPWPGGAVAHNADDEDVPF